MKNICACCALIICTTVFAPSSGRAEAGAKGITGTFIQLNRQNAEYSIAQWKALLERSQALGIDTLIIQWTAEAPVLYFKDKNLEFKEQFDAIGRLLEAARGMSFSILLGLQNDPSYWKEITARDKALRDYFLVRQAQNERIQTALLKAFGKRDDWVGYYIPDEIDDLSWRDAGRRGLLQDYLRATTKSLRDHDNHRAIAISAFFRARTAPAVVAATLNALTADKGMDYLLIQDGAGNGDPPDNVRQLYYRAIRDAQQSRSPELWAVIEAFRQTSENEKPFTAKPAPPESFQKQIRAAAGFPRRIVFAFPEYIAPDRGPAARALYELLGRQVGLPEKMPMHHADN